MTLLAIPPQRVEDIDRAKEFLFRTFGESRWSEERYLDLSDSTNHLIELSEGRLIVLPMPTPKHQDIVGNIYLVFRRWASEHKGKTLMAPVPVRLWSGKFREPDVMLFSAEHRDRVGEKFSGPPDLAVEILSPGSIANDKDEKFKEYARAGIPEYWILDSEQPSLEQYLLEGEKYRLHAQLGSGDMARADVLAGLEVSIDVIYTSD
ncbi:MAG: Uma2 family endonuclease [Chloroflexi bacterium]|nr:Uma2 family endonuclease [Chloroflexota bacterium]